ncbi:MAG: FAD-binding protein, partial [Armatimonadota bacterium]
DQWERAYGARGFFQLQSFLPASVARQGFADQIERLQRAGQAPFLSVMKRHRADRFPLSPNLDGFSLALDFPFAPGLRELLVAEQERVIEAGGRFYFAKDMTLTPSQVVKMLGGETLRGLRKWKATLDPDGLLMTDLGARLNLGG